MNKALIVGIDFYKDLGALSGCVNDAYEVKTVLERHADGTVNFPTPRLVKGTSSHDAVSRDTLRTAIKELFNSDSEIALFYFAGHGHIEDEGGYLCSSDSQSGHDGMPLSELLTIASQSKARNKVIVLDSCHSGTLGASPTNTNQSTVSEGMTILTASTAGQYAAEIGRPGEEPGGLFTSLFLDALRGAAANLLGDITPGSVYAHIDQALGPWKQRPVFKTNVKSFVSLRRATPPIPLTVLQEIATLFPTSAHQYPLDPSYEPERPEIPNPEIPQPDPLNTRIFGVLQQYVKVNLVRPVDAPHMWHAAMGSKSCELTVLGQHYRDLVEKGLI